MRTIRCSKATARLTTIALIVTIAEFASDRTFAGPSPEAARRCQHYSYLAYPYKRPGAVRMSGDRQAYFKDCLSKDGQVPEPPAAKS